MRRPGTTRSIALLALLLPLAADAAYRFDESGDYVTKAADWPAWADNLERYDDQRDTLLACVADENECSRRLKSLRVVIEKGAALEPDKQLRLVNRYINKRRYRRDRRQVSLSVAPEGEAKLKNHWVTLLEFLERGGDCEDYAVAKYFLLRELGFAAEDMRVLVTRERRSREYHAVLAVRRDDGSSWLLEIDNTIVKGSHRGYRFIYALNEEGIWNHAD